MLCRAASRTDSSITRFTACRPSTPRFMGSPRFEGFEAGGVVREGSGLPATEEEEGMQSRVSRGLTSLLRMLVGLIFGSNSHG
jgi:hypothetical protein